MLTIRDITEALKGSRKVQADYTDHGKKARKTRNTLTVQPATVKKAGKQDRKRWELLNINLVKVVNGRRLKSVPTTLLKAAELLGKETVADLLDKRLTYIPVPLHNAAFECEWAYTTRHWA